MDQLEVYQLMKEDSNHISGDSAPQNHGYHNAKEDNNNNRVDETKPMYPWIKNMEIIVPSSCLRMISEFHGVSCVSNTPMACRMPRRVGHTQSNQCIHMVK